MWRSTDAPCSVNRERNELWLKAWEDRLRWREAAIEEAAGELGLTTAKSRATPVLSLSCASCQKVLSNRGMKVALVVDPSQHLYSTNERPDGVIDGSRDCMQPQCKCRFREFTCSCGWTLGYNVREWCADCSAHDGPQEGADHCWFMFADCIVAEPRIDVASGEALMWPGYELCRPSYSYGHRFLDENVPTATEVASKDASNHIRRPAGPLSDLNGRPTRVEQHDLLKMDGDTISNEELLQTRETALLQVERERLAREKHFEDMAAEQEAHAAALEELEQQYATREAVLDQKAAALEARERELQARTFQQDRATTELRAAQGAMIAAQHQAARQEAEMRRQAEAARQEAEMRRQAEAAVSKAREEAQRVAREEAQRVTLATRQRTAMQEAAIGSEHYESYANPHMHAREAPVVEEPLLPPLEGSLPPWATEGASAMGPAPVLRPNAPAARGAPPPRLVEEGPVNYFTPEPLRRRQVTSPLPGKAELAHVDKAAESAAAAAAVGLAAASGFYGNPGGYQPVAHHMPTMTSFDGPRPPPPSAFAARGFTDFLRGPTCVRR